MYSILNSWQRYFKNSDKCVKLGTMQCIEIRPCFSRFFLSLMDYENFILLFKKRIQEKCHENLVAQTFSSKVITK